VYPILSDQDEWFRFTDFRKKRVRGGDDSPVPCRALTSDILGALRTAIVVAVGGTGRHPSTLHGIVGSSG